MLITINKPYLYTTDALDEGSTVDTTLTGTVKLSPNGEIIETEIVTQDTEPSEQETEEEELPKAQEILIMDEVLKTSLL